ncbi:MAG: hypothetical protein CML66_07000 [Rhodobacteraceae bacterium]|nr:hypothetical protein [Paracoccaceae bacterium]MAY47452.1 hypothetical protein [Paracoccaceae bacterium]
MIRRGAVLAAMLLLAACQTETPVQAGASSVDPAFQAACAAKGGTVAIGLAGPACAMPQPDAGKACSSSADCAGVCLADTRTCSPVTPYFGCHELYEEGQPNVAICID